MLLSHDNLKKIHVPGLVLPDETLFDLPEKVLQFGTGVLLRGLPDYFIDKANRSGIFNGRIVVVKSTAVGSSADFDHQDSLYTLTIKGIENARKVEENIVCSAISRVLTAGNDWKAVLQFARDPNLQVVLSNTMETGIQLVEDDIHSTPPVSFPGKLLAVLYARFNALGKNDAPGLVMVPAELIVDNGKKLKAIVLELAKMNKLDDGFIRWIATQNSFCNSLVDRIVPGKPDAETLEHLEAEDGYHDDLRTVSEVYRLWAIEGDEKVKDILTFSQADGGVIIAPDIEIYRELKLRLLNGTHTLSCAAAILSGFKTVREAMDDEQFSQFVINLMLTDIAPAIPYPVSKADAETFARKVIDRFRNPHIEHLWMSISAQYSSKMKMRVIPVLLRHYELWGKVPVGIAKGFAAFLLFMKTNKNEAGGFTGINNDIPYTVTDSNAAYFCEAWKETSLTVMVDKILKDTALWGVDLAVLPGFRDAVYQNLDSILQHGMLNLLNNNDLEGRYETENIKSAPGR